ncbi:extracellular solute-binding protein [Paenibacillus daejeonensis]|uniref:extracellular solute-binding protein n=1 Tax=Paenibacillus daejeonensis TaxID=135193 RepID=UPI000364CCB6|nr:extracellular solute-binding protein [Paenibacillus daejeonensis]
MHRKLKKGMPTVAASMLSVMLLVSACSNDGGGSAGTGETAQPKFSASIYDRGAVAADQGTYEKNKWTDWIDQESGVDVTWVPIPRSQEQDKLNVMVASGQAPDVITSYDRAMLARFINQGVAQPIDEYIEKYSTSYKAYLEANPELLPHLTFDGEMYAIASLRPTRAQTQIWIRQDWLDKLNLTMPTTVDELLEVARAFRDGDPDGNNANDTTAIAMSSAYGAIIDDWYMARSGEWFLEDGEAVMNFFTGRFEDSLAFRKQVYEEGLVDKEFVTDQNHARQKQLWVTGKSGIMFGTILDGPYPEFFENQSDAVMVPVPPLATKYGTNGYQKEQPNYLLSIMNKDTKDPEAIIKFVDWMIEDGWRPLTYGEEGVHHVVQDDQAVIIDSEKFKNEVSFMGEYRIVHQETMTPESLMAAAGDDPVQQKIAELRGEMIKISEATPYRKDFPYPPTVNEFSDVSGQFSKKWTEVVTQVTMGGPTQTPEWGIDQLEKEWSNLGGPAINELVQEWYEANKDSLD